MASRISGVISGYIHGSVTVLSELTEWMEKRGWKMPCCTQRSSSSGSGRGPWKPAMSQLWVDTPDRLMPRMVAMVARRVSHDVEMSPTHGSVELCIHTRLAW